MTRGLESIVFYNVLAVTMSACFQKKSDLSSEVSCAVMKSFIAMVIDYFSLFTPKS